MKRKSLTIVSLIFVMLISCFGLVACAPHEHAFTKKTATADYLVSAATCEDEAVYYYSCECGEKGTETFKDGSALGHAYGEFTANNDGTHTKVCATDATHVITENCAGGTATCTAKAVCSVCNAEYGELAAHSFTEAKKDAENHWLECVCGEKSSVEAHSYTELKKDAENHWYECSCGEKGEAEAHKGGEATCTAQALCEVCNEAYGDLEPHNYAELKKDATNHWKECVCGDKAEVEAHKGGTATCTAQANCEVCNEAYGDLAPHNHTESKYDAEKHWLECVCSDKKDVEAHEYTTLNQDGTNKWYECACGKVDERYLIAIDEQIALSINGKKLFFNNTELAGAEVIGVIYNGASILANGELDVSAFAINAEAPYVLHIETSLNRYELNNVVAYTEVFENTAESRELMASIFRGREAENGILNGSYALAENLYFNYFALDENGHKTYDEDGNVIYSRAEAFNADIGWNKVVGTDEEGKEITEKVVNTFSGTFDGRGYSLNNVLMDGSGTGFYGIFGYYAGNGATIKNVAINDFCKVGRKTISKTKGYDSFLFAKPESVEAVLTLENVYIYREFDGKGDNSSGGLLYYNNYEGSTTSSTLNVINMKNVIIVDNNNYEGNKQNPAFFSYGKKLGAGSVVSDVYIVTNSVWGDFNVSLCESAENYGFIKPAKVDGQNDYTKTIEEMIANFKIAGYDFAAFANEYWTMVDGIPAWTMCSDIITATDAEGKTSSSIAESGEYVINLVSDGKAVEGITTSSESEYITCNGANVVVAGEGVKFSATVNVYYREVLVGTIAVDVDNRVATIVADEILISKADSKMYLNSASEAVKALEIQSISYNGALVYEEGLINTAAIDVAVNTAFTLNVTTADGKYAFTNAKLYDAIFENTVDSRRAFVTLLKGEKPAEGEPNNTLTGYYVLAENLTFDIESSKETFASSNNIFDATFDGRGYALVNVNLANGSFMGMFGNVPGENAVLKNFAINGIYHNKALTSGYEGLFFSQGSVNNDEVNNTLTMSNVYIYRKFESTASNAQNCNILAYNRSDQLTLNMSNVIVEIEMATDSNKNANFASGKPLGTATDTYFLINGRACQSLDGSTGYRRGAQGTVYYGSANDADLSVARAAMVAANNDYTSFSADYWTITNGLPVWNSIIVA